jgi:hypothetical protein
MPAFCCDTRTFHWDNGSFRPRGKLVMVGSAAATNPAKLQEQRDVWSARLFVGFNVQGKPTWTIDDLAEVVFAERRRQRRTPDASLLMQKGIYQSFQTGQVETEEGAQVIILNLSTPSEPAVSADVFRKEMIELAEAIARQFNQETVIVEIQRNGISQQVWEVTP